MVFEQREVHMKKRKYSNTPTYEWFKCQGFGGSHWGKFLCPKDTRVEISKSSSLTTQVSVREAKYMIYLELIRALKWSEILKRNVRVKYEIQQP